MTVGSGAVFGCRHSRGPLSCPRARAQHSVRRRLRAGVGEELPVHERDSISLAWQQMLPRPSRLEYPYPGNRQVTRGTGRGRHPRQPRHSSHVTLRGDFTAWISPVFDGCCRRFALGMGCQVRARRGLRPDGEPTTPSARCGCGVWRARLASTGGDGRLRSSSGLRLLEMTAQIRGWDFMFTDASHGTRRLQRHVAWTEKAPETTDENA